MIAGLIFALASMTTTLPEPREHSEPFRSSGAVEVQLSCRVNETRTLTGCVVINPSAETQPYEEAALQMAQFMKIPASTDGAGPAPGWEITVPIRFPTR